MGELFIGTANFISLLKFLHCLMFYELLILFVLLEQFYSWVFDFAIIVLRVCWCFAMDFCFI